MPKPITTRRSTSGKRGTTAAIMHTGASGQIPRSHSSAFSITRSPMRAASFLQRNCRSPCHRLTDRGTHVPLVVRWPGHMKAGSTCEDLIDLSDFFSHVLRTNGCHFARGGNSRAQLRAPTSRKARQSPRVDSYPARRCQTGQKQRLHVGQQEPTPAGRRTGEDPVKSNKIRIQRKRPLPASRCKRSSMRWGSKTKLR